MLFWYWLIVICLLSKPLIVFMDPDERNRLIDPVGVLFWIIWTGIWFLFNSDDFVDDDGNDIWTWKVCLIVFAFIWWAVTRMTDEDYDMEKGISRAFRANKKCPRCMNDLPSLATTKCPHCTAELTGDL